MTPATFTAAAVELAAIMSEHCAQPPVLARTRLRGPPSPVSSRSATAILPSGAVATLTPIRRWTRREPVPPAGSTPIVFHRRGLTRRCILATPSPLRRPARVRWTLGAPMDYPTVERVAAEAPFMVRRLRMLVVASVDPGPVDTLAERLCDAIRAAVELERAEALANVNNPAATPESRKWSADYAIGLDAILPLEPTP